MPIDLTGDRVPASVHLRLFQPIFALLLALGVVACSGGETEPPGEADPTEAPTEAPTPAAEQPPLGMKVGRTAPDFELPKLDGSGDQKLSDLRGKVVVISFWASWCEPCKDELPALEAAWSTYKDRDTVFLGVSVDDTADPANGFLQTHPVTYPMVLDTKGIARGWQAMRLPVTVLIDQTGVIQMRKKGYSPEHLREVLVKVDGLLGS